MLWEDSLAWICIASAGQKNTAESQKAGSTILKQHLVLMKTYCVNKLNMIYTQYFLNQTLFIFVFRCSSEKKHPCSVTMGLQREIN